MATTVIFEEQVEIPMDLRGLSDFRRWTHSDQFPERGRIDYVAGHIEVDMSPEDVFCHGKLKLALASRLFEIAERGNLGHAFTDCTRVSVPDAALSVEPDIVLVTNEALETGRVRLVAKAGQPDRYIELEGPPDLIVEIVSDSSVTKDTKRLPPAYARAGVREFWLADARKEPLVFQVHRLAGDVYQPVEPDGENLIRSEVLGCRVRLEGQRDARGFWKFELVERA
ncbi:MAG: Uma2 family endonuclease [Thermoguttaceae bacterium]|nr:Uma2 family endonuclease [Thermoguttaceae bacterium]